MPEKKDGLSLEERAKQTRVCIARLEAEAKELGRRIQLAREILAALEERLNQKAGAR